MLSCAMNIRVIKALMSAEIQEAMAGVGAEALVGSGLKSEIPDRQFGLGVPPLTEISASLPS